MQLLYFHQHFTTPDGSWGTRSYEMAKALVAAGHNVTMVCGSAIAGRTGLSGPFVKGRREGSVEGIHVIEFDLQYANADGFVKRTLVFLKFSFRSVAIASKHPCDLVFATTTPLTAAIPGIAARWLRRKPFVFEVRDLWPELPRAMGVIKNPLILWAMAVLEWVAYRSATRLIGLSPGIVAGISRLGVPVERIALVPNGCDMEFFNQPAEAWRPAEIGPNDMVAAFTGTHGPANGLSAVLDAAAVLKQRGVDDIKLLLVGEGKEKLALVNRAKAEGLDNIVVFHPAVPKTKLVGLFKSIDVGMQILANVPAFYFGTSPNKFFDYLAAGKPVLCNYPGWVAELITENGAGVAVPADDPAAFADALVQLREESRSGKLKERATASAKLGQSQFSRKTLAETFISALSAALPVSR